MSLSLFERYLESFRVEAGIPGLSGIILQNNAPVWERSFGRADIEGSVAATPTTPYAIGDLAQTLGATLVLKTCVEESYAQPSDQVIRWSPLFPDPISTIGDVLAHGVPGVGFQYDVARFAQLTAVVEECTDRPYVQVLAEDIFEARRMTDSAPAHTVGALAALVPALGGGRIAHYTGVLQRLAVPYRVDPRSRVAVRNILTGRVADASSGVVSTVRDLAEFDKALNFALLLPRTQPLAWTQVSPLPTGLGWFVQTYNNEKIVWQFGLVKDSYSALHIKVPGRGLTLILLANSDGLTAPFGLERGNVSSSLFAELFLRLLVA